MTSSTEYGVQEYSVISTSSRTFSARWMGQAPLLYKYYYYNPSTLHEVIPRVKSNN